VSEVSGSIFQAQPRTQSLLYYWREGAARPGKFDSFSGGHQIWEDRTVISLLEIVLDFRCVASCRNYSASNAKFGPNFAHFDSCKY